MKKRTALTIIATSLTVATIGITTAFTNKNNSNNNTFYKMVSGDGTYQFTLTSSESFAGVSKNMTVGSGTTYTTLGNEVYWEYLYGYTNSNFITLDEGGYLTNTSDIWGINKITITATQDIKYISNEEEKIIDTGSGEITLTPTDSFTLMSLTDGTSITSLTVKYSCSSLGGLYTYSYDSGNDLYAITSVNNKALTTYVVPSTHDNKTVIMNQGIFSGCSSITSLIIPSLNSLVEQNITGQGLGFYFKTGTIPSNMSTLNSNISSSLRKVVIKNGNIIDRALQGASNIAGLVLLNIGTIGVNAFNGAASLSNIYLNDGITSIGATAFNNIGVLQDIFIPLSVTTVGTSLFIANHKDITIRCAASEKPGGWHDSWFGSYESRVTWGATR